MLKELDVQTMEETSGGTFCLLGGLLWGVFSPLLQPKTTCPTPAPAPTCPTQPAPTCPKQPAPTCPTPTPTPKPFPS